MKYLFSLALLCLSYVSGFGQTALLTEHFNYPADSLLQSNGWFGHSAASTNPIRVTNGGLSWTTTPYIGSGVGNAAAVRNTGADENRPFSSFVSSGSVYSSFLLRVDSTPVASTDTSYFFHIGQYGNTTTPVFTTISTAFRGRTFVLPGTTTSNFRMGLTFNANSAGTNVTSQTFNIGQTYLVVMKYTFVPGALNDSVSLFVFPDGGNIAQEPAIPTLGPFAGTAADLDVAQLVALRQYSATQRITVDGIVVRTNWNLTPPPPQSSLPITWDAPGIGYTFTDFGGNSSALAPSPTDTTNRTLRTVKTAGAQTWAGTTITPGTGLTTPIPFATGATAITVKVHAPASGIVVRLKAENAANPALSVETEATTTSAGWQNMVFNFANQASGTAPINFSTTYNMLSIFYGFGTSGNGAVFFADSVFFGGTPVGPPPAMVNLPITWDNLALTYGFTDFGGNNSNLAPSPTDSTNRTLRTVKTTGAQTWAGTTITPSTGLAMPIPFATGATRVSVKVFAPAAGVIVRLKAEQAGVPTISVETEDTTTMVGWQTLEFNFANQATGTAPINFANTYNMLSIFYGFGTAGTGAVFFADSVYFGGSGPVGPPPALVNLPITWDNLTLTYGFTDFGGNISSLAPSPTDSTNRTLRSEKTVGAQTWAGTTITPAAGLGMPIPFATGATTLSVKVFSPAAGVIVRLKAEQAGAPTISVETEDTTTTVGWQTLEFNFSNQAAGTAPLNLANTYNVLSIFYGFGTAGTGAVFYADSVYFGGSGPVGPPPSLVNLPITWDDLTLTYGFTDFGGNSSSLAPSPTDSTNRTLRSEKTVGAQTWAGTTLTPATGLAMPIPFALGSSIAVKVHAPAAGVIVRLKAEQAGVPTISVETEDTTTAAGWQTLVFNFANHATGTAPLNLANTYNMLSIFYGFGSAGTGAVFFADSVYFGGGPILPPPPIINLPITWDNPAITYTFTDFGGNSSALAPSPTDSTNITLRSEKTVGAQTWAGTTITPPTGLTAPIPFALGATSISVKVHAPAAGVVVRLKAEQAGVPTVSVETEATTTAAGWQTLVFNFANPAAGTAQLNLANTYNVLSIFYGFGAAGTGAVYYADSVFFGGGPVGPPPTPINLPITWDNLALNYNFTDFGGNNSTLAPSPTDSTNRTLRTEKTVGAQTWAGTTLTPPVGLATAIPFVAGATTMTVKVHAPAAGIVVRLKAEQAGVPTISVETEATTTAAGWQNLVFNFANQATGTAPINFANTYNMLSIFYGFGTAGSGAIFYADSVFFGGSGPVGPPPTPINLPITWDNLALNYSFTDFGGNASALAPSPTDPNNRTLRSEKTVGAQTWAGTTITPATGLGTAIPFAAGATTMTVKVHAPAAGIAVRLKAEQAGTPTISVETDATTTAAGWQNLVFNFANHATGTSPINFANTYNMLSIFYGFGTAGTGAIFHADSVFFGGTVVTPPQLVSVTFQVDMSRETISPNGVHMAGDFQGWSPNATPMVSQGNGIYTRTLQLPVNATYQFKYINGNQWGPGFDEAVPAACAQNNNRFVVVGNSNVTTPLVCFGRCEACGVNVFEPGALNANIKVYPNPARSEATIAYQFETPGDLQISVYNVRGQLVATRNEKGQTEGQILLNVQDWAEGLYHIRISNGFDQIARQLVVSK